jgi:hypothetical protein
MTAHTTTRPAATRTATKTVAAKNSAASIDAIRAATANIKATAPTSKVKKTAPEELHTPVEEQLGTEASYFENFSNMFEGFKIPSGKRMLCSIVAQLFIISSGVWSGIQVGAYLSLAAMVLTGSGFLAFISWFVAIGISIYGSLVFGARVARYIALGEIDQDISSAKNWIGSKFSSLRARFSADAEPDHV